jgi:hypothetical protein
MLGIARGTTLLTPVIAVLLGGCGSVDPLTPRPPEPVVPVVPPPPARVSPFDSAFVRFAYQSGVGDRERVVVRDSETWAALWSRLGAVYLPPPVLPQVDFAANMVIVVTMGSRPSGGYGIVIDGFADAGGELVVAVREFAPGHSCGRTAGFTEPTAAIMIPARPWPVRFVETSGIREC